MYANRAGATVDPAPESSTEAHQDEEEADMKRPVLERVMLKHVLEVVELMKDGVLPHSVARRYDSRGWEFGKACWKSSWRMVPSVG